MRLDKLTQKASEALNQAQFQATQQGRFEFASGKNFNICCWKFFVRRTASVRCCSRASAWAKRA